MLLEADCQEKTVELTMPFDDFSDCADKIKAYRKKYKLTQEELAEIIGVNPLTLRAWEQTNAKPPYHIWRQHKHLFDNTVDFP